MKRLFLALITLFILSSCSNDDFDIIQPDNDLEVIFQSEIGLFSLVSQDFMIASDINMTYMNDITVGIIKNDNTGVKLITSVMNYTVVMEGSSFQDINSVSTVIRPTIDIDPSNTDAIDYNYFGIGQVIKTPSGTLYGPYHGEYHIDDTLPGGVPGFYASIGLASSTDNGNTWEKHGTLIPDVYNRNSSHQQADYGLGEPSMTYSKDSTAVYTYYVDHNRYGKQVDIVMVKFNAPGGEPDFSTPYFLTESGEWTTDIIRSKHVITHGGGKDAIFPQVEFNKSLNKYVMVYCVNAYMELVNNTPASESGVYIATSDDGINWTSEQQLIKDYAIKWDNQKSYTWHPTIVYDNSQQTSGILIYSKGSGNSPHMMYGKSFQLQN